MQCKAFITRGDNRQHKKSLGADAKPISLCVRFSVVKDSSFDKFSPIGLQTERILKSVHLTLTAQSVADRLNLGGGFNRIEQGL